MRRTEAPRSGLRTKLAALRRRPFQRALAVMIWTHKDRFGLPGEATPLDDVRCLVMREVRHRHERMTAMAVYAPRLRRADGVVVMGPAECRALYDVRARYLDPGALDESRDRVSAQAALAALEAADDLYRQGAAGRGDEPDGLGRLPLTLSIEAGLLLPDPMFRFAEPPAFEPSAALRDLAREEARAEARADGRPVPGPDFEPDQARLESAFDRLFRRAGERPGEPWELPGRFFVRAAHRYDFHPLDGSPPPESEPGRDGEIEAGWVVRDGRWIPMIQKPDGAAVLNDDLRGAWPRQANPARQYLASQGLVDKKACPAALPILDTDASVASHGLTAWFDRMTRPAGSEAPSPMLNNLANPGFFAAEDLKDMLRRPGDRPYARLAPRPFLSRNDGSVLRFASAAWDVDLDTVPAEMFDRIRRPAPAMAAMPAAMMI